MWDAEFHAFQKLSSLAERLLPGVRHYTVDQCNALHEYAAFLYNAARYAQKGVDNKL